MSKIVLTGCRIFAGGADITSASNKAELQGDADSKDVTTYGSGGWTEVTGGLKTGAVNAEGFWEAGNAGLIDDEVWADLGGVVPFTVGPIDANVGSLAYTVKAMRSNYTLLGAVGDVAPWKADAVGTWPLVRGLFYHPPGTARTSTGTGTAVQGVAVTTGKGLYSSLHVLSASGTTPSLTVIIESSVDNTFASPTTVLTHTAATGITSEALRSLTVGTNTWYRAKWTISGTTPSFTFVVALGVA